MYRKRFRRIESGTARFITFSTYRRLPLFTHDAIKDLFATSLASARERDGFALYAWVVMPEHVHLLMQPRQRSLSQTTATLKSSLARRVIARWHALDAPILLRLRDDQGRTRFRQRGGGFDRVVRDAEESHRELGYIHENPVTRELAATPTDWAWSSARWYRGDREGKVPIDDVPR